MKETPIRDNILGFNRYTWYKKWQFWVAFFVLMSIIDQLDISKDVEQAKNLEKVSEKIIIVKNIVDEKDSLLKSYIYEGKSEITKPVMKKESGNVTLQISPSVISDNAKTFGQDYVKRSTESKVTVEYDELWEFKNIGGLSEQQIKDSYNDLDIIRCYWKENKVQACVGLEKKYNGKVDKNNSKIAVYEIVGIDSRNDVLKSLVGD